MKLLHGEKPKVNQMFSLRKSIHRYGLAQTLGSALLRRLRKVVEFELCLIAMNSGKPYNTEPHAKYPTREVTDAELFHQSLHQELLPVDYTWAFQRGDLCVANFDEEVIIGYGLGSNLPTQVRPGVEFMFPPWCHYGYASHTALSYRGNGLARYRWAPAQAAFRHQHGHDPREVYYMDLANSATLKSDQSTGTPSIRLGYTLYWMWRQRVFCWNSPGAKRHLCGFRATTLA